MNEREAPNEAVAFIRALVNAWDCCGTCAGGVLAKRDRERDATLVAQARSDALAPVLALAERWAQEAVEHGPEDTLLTARSRAVVRAAASSHPTGNQP
jgi:hypothetical protein